MSENTPAEGNYGGAGNADQLDYAGTYERTDNYDYPAGAYGVMYASTPPFDSKSSSNQSKMDDR